MGGLRPGVQPEEAGSQRASPGRLAMPAAGSPSGVGRSRRDDWNPGLTSPAGQKGPRYPRGFLLVPEQHPFQGDPSGSSSPPLSCLLLTFSRHFLRLGDSRLQVCALAELPRPGRTATSLRPICLARGCLPSAENHGRQQVQTSKCTPILQMENGLPEARVALLE